MKHADHEWLPGVGAGGCLLSYLSGSTPAAQARSPGFNSQWLPPLLYFHLITSKSLYFLNYIPQKNYNMKNNIITAAELTSTFQLTPNWFHLKAPWVAIRDFPTKPVSIHIHTTRRIIKDQS